MENLGGGEGAGEETAQELGRGCDLSEGRVMTQMKSSRKPAAWSRRAPALVVTDTRPCPARQDQGTCPQTSVWSLAWWVACDSASRGHGRYIFHHR